MKQQSFDFVGPKPLIYLASPHNHFSAKVRNARWGEAIRCNTWMVENGLYVYSPIVSSHPIGCRLSGPFKGWEFWKDFDIRMIEMCDEVWFLLVDGYKESKGMKAEFGIARLLGKAIRTISRLGFTNKYKIKLIDGNDNEERVFG